MAGHANVLGLLEEMLDSGKTPEEACHDCPELLCEVRRRWKEFCLIDAEVEALFPEQGVPPDTFVTTPGRLTAGLPQVPGYEVEALLGRGGMGVVYKARHLRLNRTVALKMLIAGTYASPQELSRFQREAEAVAALRHTNIVQVYDVADHEGRPYFTMEFIEGGSLAQKLAGLPQPARQAAALTTSLAEAVQVAHQGGIVHRDLKPANVLLTADGTPRITDFGIARRIDEETVSTQSGVPLGTPSYMAPEQAQGQRDAIGPATDVYALGAILYEVLTGRPPFRAETTTATLQQVISENPVPPSRLNASVPRDLETICLKCLHKEPHLRYASAAALAVDLHYFLRGEAIMARPERWLGRLARWVRRRPVFSVAVAAGTLVLVGLLAGGLWLITDRAAAAREVAAERDAMERAAAEDLRDMVALLKSSSWPEARAAAERARGRLGNQGSSDLRRLLDQGTRELQLAVRLEEIRLYRAYSGQLSVFVQPDEYEEAFRAAGLGQVGDDPEAVADRIRASNIPVAMVAALDHWSVCTSNPHETSWVLAVARRADSDPTGWRDRARDPAVRANQAALVEVIRTAPVAGQSVPLLLALNRHLTHGSPERLPFLKKVQQTHPGDFWGNLTFGTALEHEHQPREAIRYYQAAVAIRPQASLGYHDLGMALLATGRTEEAVEQLQRAVGIDPTSVFSYQWLNLALASLGRQDEAIEQLQAAIRFNPNNSGLQTRLGDLLEKTGRHAEALSHHRQAVALDPKNRHAQDQLRSLLVRLGQGNEARAAWQKSLEADSTEHKAWDGYAEFCLFLGQEDEYRRARQALFARFGATTDPHIMERIARACLLRPGTEDELKRVVALVERALTGEPSPFQTDHRNLLFTQGVAEYRQGRFDRAIALMRGEAASALGPAPRLVLAMALYRSGQAAEARQTLAAAVLAHDWRASQVNDQYGWTFHVLRREAEGLVLPNLPAFRRGEYQPQDKDERLALLASQLASCEFQGLHSAAARLYSDAIAADPKLAEDVPAGTRYHAARAAALAGCGQGKDADQLDDKERALRRRQALDWLRQDLTGWGKRLDNGNAETKAQVRLQLQPWQMDPDLDRVRAKDALARLPDEERERWERLWSDVDALLRRASPPE
jgi:serine/threonine-protein kinase